MKAIVSGKSSKLRKSSKSSELLEADAREEGGIIMWCYFCDIFDLISRLGGGGVLQW